MQVICGPYSDRETREVYTIQERTVLKETRCGSYVECDEICVAWLDQEDFAEDPQGTCEQYWSFL